MQPDDRPARAQPRDRRRRAAGEGRHEDRPCLERLGDVARGIRHRLPDRRLLLRLRDLVPVAEARLDRAGDSVHVGDRLERELADRGLAGEHQRAGAVEDGVRDIRSLGARRLRRMDHRLEHLRCRDHRLPALERTQDDPLLQQRHLGRADLDAEVAARDHHAVREAEDVVESRDCLGLLDLRDHVGGRPGGLDQRLQRLHVGGGTNERERDEIDAELERELEVVDVLAGQRRDRQRDAGEVDALVGGDDAADEHLAARAAAVDLHNSEPHGAIVDQNVEARLQHRAEHRRRDREVVALGDVLACDRHLSATLERDGLGELADAELRPLQVGDQSNRAPDLLLKGTDRLRARPVILVGAVREVQAGTVDRAHQLLQDRRVGRGRPDRGDDLGAAWDDRHAAEPNRDATWGTPTSRRRQRGRRARPRSSAAGSAWGNPWFPHEPPPFPLRPDDRGRACARAKPGSGDEILVTP